MNAHAHPAPDDDELPPYLGERYRDTYHDIQRAAWEAEQEEPHHD